MQEKEKALTAEGGVRERQGKGGEEGDCLAASPLTELADLFPSCLAGAKCGRECVLRL